MPRFRSLVDSSKTVEALEGSDKHKRLTASKSWEELTDAEPADGDGQPPSVDD